MKRTLFIISGLILLGLLIPAGLNAQVIVKGNKAWTKTKLKITIDDKVKIQAAGTLTLDPNVTCTADGMKVVSGPEHVVVKSANRGALLARIGKSGAPIIIGADGTFTAATAGVLYFGINDDNVKNNGGSYNLSITVNGKTQ